jgi:hypothetical protein
LFPVSFLKTKSMTWNGSRNPKVRH